MNIEDLYSTNMANSVTHDFKSIPVEYKDKVWIATTRSALVDQLINKKGNYYACSESAMTGRFHSQLIDVNEINSYRYFYFDKKKYLNWHNSTWHLVHVDSGELISWLNKKGFRKTDKNVSLAVALNECKYIIFRKLVDGKLTSVTFREEYVCKFSRRIPGVISPPFCEYVPAIAASEMDCHISLTTFYDAVTEFIADKKATQLPINGYNTPNTNELIRYIDEHS